MIRARFESVSLIAVYSRNPSEGTLDSAVTGIWRPCIRCLSALPASVETKQEPWQPLLIALVSHAWLSSGKVRLQDSFSYIAVRSAQTATHFYLSPTVRQIMASTSDGMSHFWLAITADRSAWQPGKQSNLPPCSDRLWHARNEKLGSRAAWQEFPGSASLQWSGWRLVNRIATVNGPWRNASFLGGQSHVQTSWIAPLQRSM